MRDRPPRCRLEAAAENNAVMIACGCPQYLLEAATYQQDNEGKCTMCTMDRPHLLLNQSRTLVQT
jgi:hypothetical protein